VKPPTPEGVGFLGIVCKPLSEARAGPAGYNILGLAVPDQDFRAMRSDAKDVGIGKAVPLAQWKSLIPLIRTARGPGQPIHRVWRTKASPLTVLRGEPSPPTANHGCKQQEERIDPEALIVSTRTLNPRRERRGPVALSGRRRRHSIG
jgi:hypothetical protein